MNFNSSWRILYLRVKFYVAIHRQLWRCAHSLYMCRRTVTKEHNWSGRITMKFCCWCFFSFFYSNLSATRSIVIRIDEQPQHTLLDCAAVCRSVRWLAVIFLSPSLSRLPYIVASAASVWICECFASYKCLMYLAHLWWCTVGNRCHSRAQKWNGGRKEHIAWQQQKQHQQRNCVIER